MGLEGVQEGWILRGVREDQQVSEQCMSQSGRTGISITKEVGLVAQCRVVAIEGKPVVRPVMTLTLSCDHRVVDGARAAMFMNDVAEALREPEKWLA